MSASGATATRVLRILPISRQRTALMQRFTPAWERRRLGRQRGVRLFVLPPRSPQLNGRVERANRTHTEEFYEITPGSLPITQLNQELLDGERTYNTFRPHQALGYLTPQELLARNSSQQEDPKCH
jgi:transposase InsO family protein